MKTSQDGLRQELILPLALGGIAALLHLLTASDTYGIFRDELYYVACARHLDFGYVDHPPMIAILTRLSMALLGDSLVALRTLPALAAGGTVTVTMLMARELGGARLAQLLAGVMAFLAPVYIGVFGYLSMNSFDVLIWASVSLVIIRLLRTRQMHLWLWFGLLAGLGLQNKLSIVFLGFGLVAGIVITRDWAHFRSRQFWIGGLIAAAIFAPNLIWQSAQGWPTLEFMENATRDKILPLAPVDFLMAQITMMNPVALPLVLLGLFFYLLSKEGRPFRALGWTILVVTVSMVMQRTKAYYLSPLYTLAFAPGGVMVERLAAARGWGWLRYVVPALLIMSGLALTPLAKPFLPVDRFLAYQAMLGRESTTEERNEVGRLPQFFADRLGWQDLAQTVSEVYLGLSETDQKRACVYGQNYGHAGAINYFASEFDLPPAIAGHNSYYLWGPGECTGEVMIIIDGNREDHLRAFEQVDQITTYRCDDCMPYESTKPIWVVRRLRLPIEEAWVRSKHYD